MIRQLSNGYAVMYINNESICIANAYTLDEAYQYEDGDFYHGLFHEEHGDIGSYAEIYKAYKSMLLEYLEYSSKYNEVVHFNFIPTDNDRLHAYAMELRKILKGYDYKCFVNVDGDKIVDPTIEIYVTKRMGIDWSKYVDALQ